MKNKKIILLFLILLIAIFIVGLYAIKYVKNKKQQELNNEYIPQEEISEEQSRQTIVSLYFIDKETNIIKPEARLVNAKDLLDTPFNVIVSLLVEGPKNEKLKSAIPENTKILNVQLDKGCLTIDFSAELLDYDKDNEKAKDNIINTIVNTVTEFKEIDKVKITINGEGNAEFEGEYTRK